MIKLKSRSYSIHGLENCRTDVVLVGMKTLVSLYISIICTLLLGEEVHYQWRAIFWKESFFFPPFLGSSSQQWVYYSINQVVNRCVNRLNVPFLQHRQSHFNMTFKGVGTFQMVSEHSLQVTSSIATNKRVSLSMEVLKSGIDFSLLAMKVLGASCSNRRLFHLHWKPVF